MLTMELVKQRALSHLRRDLVLNALDDYVPLSSVTWEIRERLDPATDVKAVEAAVSLVRDLLTAGMIEVGDLVNKDVVRWEGSRDSVIARVETAMKSDAPSESGWIVPTEKARGWAQQYERMLDQLRA